MSRTKIINDPIYGLISFPFEFLYEIIEHPIFQRLRRISQMGLSNYVYPGATHSRFSHALGALHLMCKAINTLKKKGVEISEEEHEAVCLAILLHDVGHGPFSHALENIIIETDHEDISIYLMNLLNQEYNGRLDLAIQLFKGEYHRSFLKQLVSSQLDMDRMDYLTRDSYYSGVAEGVIGYDRIISMLNVANNELVVEEKGIFSIEKFLVARHIMYWQVYLHKTSIVSEQMLKLFVKKVKQRIRNGKLKLENKSLEHLLAISDINGSNFDNNINCFLKLDDIDVFSLIKKSTTTADQILQVLSNSLLNRRLFAIILQNDPISGDLQEQIRQNVKVSSQILQNEVIEDLMILGKETTKAYDHKQDRIKILKKNGEITDISQYLYRLVEVDQITKHYLCYPKFNS